MGLLSKREQPPKKTAAEGNCGTYLGIVSLLSLIYLNINNLTFSSSVEPKISFVERNGTTFMLDGRPFYVNGWNSYWLMDQAVDEKSRGRVTEMFKAGRDLGLTVCRTWGFNDGTYHALQVSLGRFDEEVFKALDRVIAEARQHGIRLLLSLVNNLQAMGGKSQYVRWAIEEGIGLTSSNDSFFFDPSIRIYFKSYIKTILTRKNHLNGIEYRDDPTIFAWELINEPQCTSDQSGDTLQDWIEEMSQFVKSIDKKHLLTIGLEGFYGSKSSKEKLSVNPGEWYKTTGSDFIRNNKISTIDFTSVHIYPDQWLEEADLQEKMEYVNKWVSSHIEDGDKELGKPVMFTEFGLSNNIIDFDHSQREAFYKSIFDAVYDSAKENGAGSGALIWQFLVRGMEEYNDDFGVVPGERPSLDKLIKDQSCRLAKLNYGKDLGGRSLKNFC
ncbi:uncharacterized protein A4U43_C06F12370 [Asparagus officinalis]|uniref:mannan endo-1,4-beta-mannosidase n=1 Tax=Asparagus officinalis TaxID=4686 RepID=A0A5P1ELE9_ASPOF|nr:mannan endo-1,4-beta-mannosidase 2-like [Asparagus officinalis]ONK66822.1 uncharacterized protein A4U43_C06F12370 [Asparagus officinalis]